jgi:endothelin-converting enzyme/putative endopeptidase
MSLASDPHPPDRFRANEVRNMDAWYDAFGVKPGDAWFLPPEQRVRIW